MKKMVAPSLETIIGGDDGGSSDASTIIECYDGGSSDASDDDVDAIVKNYIDFQGHGANQEEEATQADWRDGYYTHECSEYSHHYWSDEYVSWSNADFSQANGSQSWTHWQSYWAQAYPTPQHQEQPLAELPRKTMYNEKDTIERLLKEKEELEEKSSNKLRQALVISRYADVSTDLIFFIKGANFFLDYQGVDSSPRGAADAVKRAWIALGMCKRKNELYDELETAVKAIRDVLSVRTQLASLPLGNKKKYSSVLQAAWVETINDEENSRQMQSYRKTVWEKFPGAFPSNNKKENVQRGGPRPRRERNSRSRCEEQGKPLRGGKPSLPQAQTVATVITPPPGLEDVVQWQ